MLVSTVLAVSKTVKRREGDWKRECEGEGEGKREREREREEGGKTTFQIH